MQDLKFLVWNSLLETEKQSNDKENILNKNLEDKSNCYYQFPYEKLWIHPIVYSFFVHNRPKSYFKFKVFLKINIKIAKINFFYF